MNRVHHILMALLLAASGSALADEVTYLHTDLLGSPIAATDENGALLWEERYEPYGERYYEPATASGNKRSFTGHAEDASGLVYMGARYYNPEIGRFYAADPGPLFAAGPGFVNRYAYVANAPTIGVDRDGRAIETIWDVASLSYGMYSLQNNWEAKNYGAAAWDALGVTVDGLAAAVPFVPGGMSLGIQTLRAADKVADAAQASGTAFDVAKAGGKHAGTLRNYAERSPAEVQKAIRSYERQVVLHQKKIANPEQFAERWGQMSGQEQAGLVNKWNADAARNQELANVLRGLLESK